MNKIIKTIGTKLNLVEEKEIISKLSFLFLKEKKSLLNLIEEIVSTSIPQTNRPENLKDVIIFPPDLNPKKKDKEEEKE